jgi:hypothetical protein
MNWIKYENILPIKKYVGDGLITYYCDIKGMEFIQTYSGDIIERNSIVKVDIIYCPIFGIIAPPVWVLSVVERIDFNFGRIYLTRVDNGDSFSVTFHFLNFIYKGHKEAISIKEIKKHKMI